jgi:hypothetical protein
MMMNLLRKLPHPVLCRRFLSELKKDAVGGNLLTKQKVLQETLTEMRNDQEWTNQKSNQAIINQFLRSFPTTKLKSHSIDDFIKQRLENGQLTDRHRFSSTDVQKSTRILSSLLTYPLTLANCINTQFPCYFNKDCLNITILGARAESSLPLVWWKELLFSTTFASTIRLQFVGPHLQLKQPTSANTFSHQWNRLPSPCSSQKLELELSPANRTVLHRHNQLTELLQSSDLFVLFHPGYGSNELKDSWKPSLQLLLETKKPILGTAFSEKDLSEDLQQLNLVSTEEDHQDLGEPLDWIIPPSRNPFASLRNEIHPLVKDEIIRNNQFHYLFQAK